MKLAAVWTGVSSESTTTKLTEQIIKATVEQAAQFGEEVDVVRINLRDHAKSLALSMLTPIQDSALEAAFESVQLADAVVTITPIYKSAPIGIQTLFWQLIEDASLSGKPVLIGATGGTPRHSLAGDYSMRPLLSYLKGQVLPSNIFAATDDWASAGGTSQLRRRINSVARELVTAMLGSRAGLAMNQSLEEKPSAPETAASKHDSKNSSASESVIRTAHKNGITIPNYGDYGERPQSTRPLENYDGALRNNESNDSASPLSGTDESSARHANNAGLSGLDTAPSSFRERTDDTIELINKDLYASGTKFPKRKSVTADLFDPNKVTPFAQLLDGSN